ncbi:adenylate/guanylate cyclase domain-containing protein [Parazoarcus communis]|uniref:Adenylate/guanylate cyclase domain-containing protein n=1 Tax=Parazoarcus communis TaxID=41977 RepID=A0A2U8GTC9_9RHOO|nr:adenylate/guanylate cyclase domain-containing protein [Parazoarcus communis]AWI76932.1 adenylate/guanylate cyclase domain-containing protein [Parazoarcus communis]
MSAADLRPILPKSAALLPFVVLLAGLVLMVSEPAVLVSLRHAVFDHFQRLQPAVAPAEPVQVIDIDDESLARIGQWPWSRTVLARLTQRLSEAGASVIGFDVLFAEPDRTALSSDDGQLPAPRTTASDQVFSHSLGNVPSVLGFALGPRGASAPPDGRLSLFAGEGPEVFDGLHRFAGGLFPLSELSLGAGLGAINFVPDADGVVRRLPLVLALGDRQVPSLVSEMLRLAQGASGFVLREDALAGRLLHIGLLRIPVSEAGELWIHYGQLRPDRYLPAWKVLNGEVDLAGLRGRPVLIGASAQALMDLRFSPLGEVVPGVEVHAQSLEQVMAGHWLQRPANAMAIEVLVLCLVGGLVGGLALRARALMSATIAALLLLALAWGGWHAYAAHGLLLDPAVPGLLIALIFVSTSVARHIATERRQRWVRQAFERYVSPNLVDYLVSHPEELELGGVRRVCSFVFTDLADYTTLVESHDPAQVVSLINAYLDGLIRIAFAHQGTLDRIVGDAVVVMFSAPLVQADHAKRALACAGEMHAFASAFARARGAEGLVWGQTRIGVHTGEVIVGNFGGATIFDYSALGDPVNTASRLEGANKYLGTLVCVSQATLDECPEALARPAARLVLKGRSGAIAVSEPLFEASPADGTRDAEYEAAYALLALGADSALAAFERLALQRPADALVALHLGRLRQGERGDLIVLTEK